jgi:hypothetical protein
LRQKMKEFSRMSTNKSMTTANEFIMKATAEVHTSNLT